MTISRNVAVLLCLAALFSLTLTGCSKKDDGTQSPSTPSQATKTTDPVEPQAPVDVTPDTNTPPTTITLDPATDIIVTVNGTDITEAQVKALVDPQIDALKKVDPNRPAMMFEQIRGMLRKRMIDMLVVQTLMEPLAEKAGITVSDEEIQAELENAAAMNNMTVEQLKARSQSLGQSFDSIIEQVTMLVRYTKTAEAGSPGATEVTDEEVKQYYETNKAQYDIPEKIRASHILIKVESGDAEDVKTQKRAKAEGLLKQLKEGKDFAELAKETGGYPSAPRGGDLGEFGKGDMVGPFEEAAFALEVGGLSDIVETRFGYHIIKLTGHTEATSKSFEEVKDDIAAQLKQSKRGQMLQEYIDKVRADAKIIYPEGKEPQAPPMPIQ